MVLAVCEEGTKKTYLVALVVEVDLPRYPVLRVAVLDYPAAPHSAAIRELPERERERERERGARAQR
jgi:hypothetical protein